MTIQPLHTPGSVCLAIICAAAISLSVYRGRLMTAGGALAAALIGGIVFVCGGWGGAAALLSFFFSSSLLGRFHRAAKSRLGFEKGGRRDAWQALANGGLAAGLIALSRIPHFPADFLRLAFLAALAEANADTWATEIGAGFGWPPRSITTFRRALPGESGAISLPGTLAAFAGAALIGLFATPQNHFSGWLIVTSGGFAGALIDSVLGATIQAQYAAQPGDTDPALRLFERRPPGARLARGFEGVDNDKVNFLATIAAAIVSGIIWRTYH